jgi:predicted amidophosphoribosyltransferase
MRKRRPRGQAKTTCSKCNKEVEESRRGQRYCKGCHKDYQRAYRAKSTGLRPEKIMTDKLSKKQIKSLRNLNQYDKMNNTHDLKVNIEPEDFGD